MLVWLAKGLALLGDAYNGADAIVRGTTDVILKTLNLG